MAKRRYPPELFDFVFVHFMLVLAKVLILAFHVKLLRAACFTTGSGKRVVGTYISPMSVDVRWYLRLCIGETQLDLLVRSNFNFLCE